MTARALLLSLLVAPGALAQAVTVEWDDVRQTIDGFGASDAWFADDIAAHPQRGQIMDLLFKTSGTGAGLSILRQRVAPNPHPADGSYDWNHDNWTGSGWVAQQAQARGVGTVWASAWTAPKWMKTNGKSSGGGFLLADRYDDYADWLATWVERMETQYGITYYAVSPQNEPGTKPWESMEWTPDDYNVFLRDHLRPEFNARSLSTNVVAPEETNWDDVPLYADVFMADPVTSSFVDIIGGHVYGGNPNSSYNGYGKPVWETEWSYDTSVEDDGISNGVRWAVNFWKLLVNAEVRAAHHWWLVNFNEDGKQQGLINATATGYTTTKRLFTIGQFSRFVRPGWQRIDATSKPYGNVYIAAFRHPSNGQFALVAINEGTSDRAVTFSFDGFTAGTMTPHQTSGSQSIAGLTGVASGAGFSTTLPAQSVTTFRGTGTPAASTPNFPQAGVWYTLRNVARNQVLDTGASGAVKLEPGTSLSEGKEFRFISADGGYYWIDNRRAGRGALDTSGDGVVTWKAADQPTGDDKLWQVLDAGSGAFRFRNKQTGRDYLYGDASGGVRWNTGGTGNDTKWRPESSAAVQVASASAVAAPAEFALRGAHPNPSTSSAVVRFDLPEASEVSLVLYDLLGRVVYESGAVQTAAGAGQSLRVDTSSLPAGAYVYRLRATSGDAVGQASGRLTVVR